ncbi:MAG: VCBS repeat-containing protein [Planctomycetes bacterium]|nr:VCBS repeat-containing protein [Planctomycetota bacterium]
MIQHHQIMLSVALSAILTQLTGAQALPTLAPPQTLSVLAASTLERIVDYDQDGDLDAVLTTYPSTSVILARNDGLGTWTLEPPILVTGAVNAVAAADLDGDGDQDLAALDLNRNLYLILNTPGGWVVSNLGNSIAESHRIDAIDWEGDGDVDLILGPQHIRLNDGAGNFGPVFSLNLVAPFTVTLTSPQVADFDGDGDTDYLFRTHNGLGATYVVAEKTGTGLVHHTVAFRQSAPQGMDSGDLNGDGLLDFVILSALPGFSAFLVEPFFQGPGFVFTPGPALRVPAPPAGFGSPVAHDAVRLADVDGDGLDDCWVGQRIGFGAATHRAIHVFRSDGSPLLQPASAGTPTFSVPDMPQLDLPDMNQDGRADLLVYGQDETAPLALGVRLNNSPVAQPLLYRAEITSGDHIRGWIDELPGASVELRVTERMRGNPAAGVPVTIRVHDGGGHVSEYPTRTGPSGTAIVPVDVGNSPGRGIVSVSAPGVQSDSTVLAIYRFEAVKNLTPPVGGPFVLVGFEHGSTDSVPLMIAVDLPTVAPIWTPYGTLHTSLLSPSPSFGALDGLGVFGPYASGEPIPRSGPARVHRATSDGFAVSQERMWSSNPSGIPCCSAQAQGVSEAIWAAGVESRRSSAHRIQA